MDPLVLPVSGAWHTACHTPRPSHCHECLVHGAQHALIHGKLFSPVPSQLRDPYTPLPYLPIRTPSVGHHLNPGGSRLVNSHTNADKKTTVVQGVLDGADTRQTEAGIKIVLTPPRSLPPDLTEHFLFPFIPILSTTLMLELTNILTLSSLPLCFTDTITVLPALPATTTTTTTTTTGKGSVTLKVDPHVSGNVILGLEALATNVTIELTYPSVLQ
ncbi:hypothetical protein E2C01_044797 [Portunus trituberculatus]|uniref:Uncharacterized protein n=1 Tax=Portunus trituberculatus TaxID=210409 RepID=A0A5B7FWI9_PORTR|nr:hypothetical protein [Portunus trituberculatus]